MAQYDLTQTMAPYLDRHLVLPILEFLGMKEFYPEEDMMKAKLELLSKTNMVDFAMDIYKKLNKTEEIPEESKAKRERVVALLKELQVKCAPLMSAVSEGTLLKDLRGDKTLAEVKEEHQITEESIGALYSYAKFQFDCGIYNGVAESLRLFRSLNSDPEKDFNALWGQLAANILTQEWEEASKDMIALKEAIDKADSAPDRFHSNDSQMLALKHLQQRTWLIHWGLFVFFNHPNGLNSIIEMFFQDKYLNTIQTTCPHILRYLATAVVANKKKRSAVKDIVRVIQQESYTYRDPITEFLEALYLNVDFEDAQLKLRECEKVLMNDFFLVACRDDFIDCARLFIFEAYCRIHQCIDIGMLAEKLNMDAEAAERWIVNLIRNAKLDAKIDSNMNRVIMGIRSPSIHQKIYEKTKVLNFRSLMLSNALAKSEAEPAPSYVVE